MIIHKIVGQVITVRFLDGREPAVYRYDFAKDRQIEPEYDDYTVSILTDGGSDAYPLINVERIERRFIREPDSPKE